MVKLHTEMPKNVPGFYGEHKFASAVTLLADDFEAWFQLSSIPGAPEIDVVLLSASHGMFAVEVKGHSIGQISEYAQGVFKTPPTPDRPIASEQRPIQQAGKFAFHFKNWIEANNGKSPWVQLAVAFPNIARAEWQAKFGSDFHSDLFIFADDLSSEGITSCLTSLMATPLRGVAQPSGRLTKSADIDNARTVLNGGLPKIKLDEDVLKAFTNPEDSFSRRAAKFLDFKSGLIQVSGKAGSGKTLFLYKWAEQRAEKGDRVLLLTFNKTLASELRRQHLALPRLQPLRGELDILDIWDLTAAGLPEGHVVVRQESGYEALFRARIQSPEFQWEPYDAIAIDESQDFQDHFFELVEQLSEPDAPWMVAYGKSQELYRDPADWPFPAIEAKGEQRFEAEVLRRSFRNAKGSALVAQAHEEHFPNLEKAQNKILGELGKRDDHEDEGLFNLNRDSSKIVFRPYVSGQWNLEQVLEEFLEVASKCQRPDRPLILFTTQSMPEYKMALTYLSSKNVPYIDLIDRDNRRDICPDGHVRLVTVNSARGIEAESVLFFGLDLLGVDEFHNGVDYSVQKQNCLYPLAKSYVGITRHKWRVTLPVHPKLMESSPEMSLARHIFELNESVRRIN